MTPHKYPPSQAGLLHDQNQRAGLDPRSVLAEVGVSAGESLLEIGAGSGFFTLALAESVGPQGQVIAADVSPGMLEALRQRALDKGWDNLKLVPSEEQLVPLTDACVDRAFLVDVLHEAGDPETLLREAVRTVHRGGGVVVIDWETGDGPPGPPARERLGSTRTKQLLESAGLPAVTPLASVMAPHFGLQGVKPETE